MIHLELPFPPTNNHLTTVARGRRISSTKCRKYRSAALAAIGNKHGRPLTDRLAVTVNLHAPTRAKRDIDNYVKAVLDAITVAQVWEDDSQIDQLIIRRGAIIKGGKCTVTIQPAEVAA